LPQSLFLAVLVAALAVASAGTVSAQTRGAARLPPEVLDVTPPSARVRGTPGTLSIVDRGCRLATGANTRQRIVDIAVQEWAFFGYRLAAPADADENDGPPPTPEEFRRRRPRLPPEEAARVASSIAGYWAVTPEGAWIVGRQNDRWNGEDGIGARWNAPWSAAFISWVMCEAGLGAESQFRRAVAHHSYIDQAIRARDGRAANAAFEAFDPGEQAILPGDLLCSSRRPMYRSLADRRRQLGVGARSHCDIIVKVDDAAGRVLAIGGNVRGVVSLKQLPASRGDGRHLRASTGNDERPIFAHLKLRAGAVPANALDASPAMAGAPATLF
jgi:hypothetical protein